MKHKKIYLTLVKCLIVITFAADYSYAGERIFVIGGNYIEGESDDNITAIEVNMALPEKLTPELFDKIVATSKFQNIVASVDERVSGSFKLKLNDRIVRIFDLDPLTKEKNRSFLIGSKEIL